MTPIETHDLGTFASVTAVWSAYPEGGHEGDYCTINGVTYRWNKYNRQWENSQLVNETTGRMVETFDGDVNIQNNLTVAGTLRAKRLKQPNCGMFGTVEALESAYPNPEVGMWAVVGDEMPGAIYRCDVEGVWEATGETGGVDGLLDDSYEQRIAALESNLDDKVDKEAGKGLSTNDYTDAEQSKLSDLPTASDIATSLASKADLHNVEQSIYAKQYVIGDEKHGEKVYLQEHGKSGTEYVTFSLGKSNRHTIVPIPSRSDTSIKLATVEDISGSIDMSGYYDKTQTDALLKGKANLHGSGKEYFRANALHMTSVPSEGEESDGNEIFATNRYNNGHQFVTIGYGAHVVKMNIPDGEETVTLATLDDVTGEIDMSGYYDKEEVDELVKDMVVPVTATNDSDEVTTNVDASDVYNALEAKRTVVYRVAYAIGNPSVRYFQVMGKTPGGIIAVYNDGAGDMERLIHVGTSISLSRLRNIQVLASMGEGYDGGHSYTPEYGDYFYANGKIYVETHVNTPDSEHVSEPLEVGVPDKNIIYCNALTNVQYRWEGSSWSALTGAIFTKDEKLKLLEIEARAEVNKIASVRVNGSDLPIRNKAVSLDGVLATKQDALESGSNIKTINNQSLLGSGNINISGGSGSGVVYVTVTENSGVFTADKTFAEVDAALTAGQLVRFFDGTNYFDITGYIATMVVVASYTTGATNEKFTYTPSDLTWERTLLAPKDSPVLTGTPTAPTAASGTNTTQIATTAFVISAVGGKQDTLVSGTNIKTVNGQSLMGSGNVAIQIPPAPPEPLLVYMTESGGTYSLDKDVREIETALSASDAIDCCLMWDGNNPEVVCLKCYGYNIQETIGGFSRNVIVWSGDDDKGNSHVVRAYHDSDSGNDVVLYDVYQLRVPLVEVAGTTPTQTLASNTYYQFTGAVTSLTLTLGTAIAGIANIYAFSFVAGAANPTISLPASVTIDGTPSIAAGDYVEFNIMNNVAIFKVVSI